MHQLALIAKRLLLDESGFIASTEMILMATIVVIGTIAGTVTVRDTLNTELADLGSAVKGVDQSYSFGSVVTPCGIATGSSFNDQSNFCTPVGPAPAIDICDAPIGGESP